MSENVLLVVAVPVEPHAARLNTTLTVPFPVAGCLPLQNVLSRYTMPPQIDSLSSYTPEPPAATASSGRRLATKSRAA